MAMIAKEDTRANRDEDMNYFATYYREKFDKMQFKEFKKVQHEDSRISRILNDDITREKARTLIKNLKAYQKRVSK